MRHLPTLLLSIAAAFAAANAAHPAPPETISYSAAANAADPASPDTTSYVDAALREVGAHSVRCPAEVRAAVRSRRMVAVCARFEGDFEDFRALWPERPRPSVAGGAAPQRSLPEATPQTVWEHRDGTYERIYGVAGSALGVRFTAGELLLVYPE